MASGYKPARDQAALTQIVNPETIRQRGLRSFRRLENAIRQLAKAFKSGTHVVSPTVPKPEAKT